MAFRLRPRFVPVRSRYAVKRSLRKKENSLLKIINEVWIVNTTKEVTAVGLLRMLEVESSIYKCIVLKL